MLPSSSTDTGSRRTKELRVPFVNKWETEFTGSIGKPYDSVTTTRSGMDNNNSNRISIPDPQDLGAP